MHKRVCSLLIRVYPSNQCWVGSRNYTPKPPPVMRSVVRVHNHSSQKIKRTHFDIQSQFSKTPTHDSEYDLMYYILLGELLIRH
jgi:hypothetical protein